ncbi:O-antigen ligase domain-containing protein [Spirosoma taeanense]|uniref:O-antigen ligase domain-containing protein n=1 Tax=Spirosoma taeanense TaxID=2735870 RepID=A0A6M5Y045_9BACT|nr:O-antigen ligase domain-containing protein [Spirosoma taeanense]QJW88158.1 O-antigen ligase domain-containing protein [Spirosoma taeanense]
MNLRVEYLPVPTGREVKLAVIGTAAAILVGAFVAVGKVAALAMLIVLPSALVVAGICFTNPMAGLMIYFNINFFVLGISRFLPDAPYGLSIDLMLVLIFIGIFFSVRRTGERRLHHPVFYLVLVWFMYTILLFFNTRAPSQVAWFFAVRGLSLYWLMVVTAGLLLINDPKHLYWLVKCWLFWSVLGALWSFRQYYIGLLPGEQQWLNEVGYKTHLLFGKQFRAFSFYTDAGQFGASMAHVSLFAGIMVLESKTMLKRVLYLLLALICFWGFAIAGTRGPLFIIFVGGPIYLLLRRNVPLLITGLTVLTIAFSLLVFTRIGQGNYQILRMRSALNMEDPSLLIRINNQILLAGYMADKPFGGGVGSGGTGATGLRPIRSSGRSLWTAGT